jgi:phage replication O-like protein O
MSLSRLNHTQTPNEFVDGHLPELSGAAVKVFLVIARQTIGWHKETDRISLSQMVQKTGLAESSASIAIDDLVERGLIVKTVIGKGRGSRTFYEINYTENRGIVEKECPENQGDKPELRTENRGNRAEKHPENRGHKRKNINKEFKETCEAEKSASAIPSPEGYKTVMTVYHDLHLQKTGAKPMIDAATGKIIKDLLCRASPDEIIKKLGIYYSGSLWFTRDGTYSIKGFRKHYDEIALVTAGGGW